MKSPADRTGVCSELLAACRIALFTIAICALLYTSVVLGIAQAWMPDRANGSLLRDNQGRIVGSRLLAQGFARPEYLWARPSAVNYNASAAGGSNLSPTGLALRSQAIERIGRYDLHEDQAIPAELATASGSGLDPHICRSAAFFQAERIARIRGLPIASVRSLISECEEKGAGPFAAEPLVNVLLVNRALDEMDRNHGR